MANSASIGAVLSYPNFWMNYPGGWEHTRKPKNAAMASILLEYGANPDAEASLRERVGSTDSVTVREHRRMTPLTWGDAFHYEMSVSRPAIDVIREASGRGA